MSPRPDSEVDTLDEAINNFQEIATIFKGESATGKRRTFVEEKRSLDLKDLKSLAYFTKLPPTPTPTTPPPIPPPPIPPPPVNYSPTPPPPPKRSHIPGKADPPPPPQRSDQSRVVIKRILEGDEAVSDTHKKKEITEVRPDKRATQRVSCTVENLDMLLADMENFNSLKIGEKKEFERRVEIEIEPENPLEKKVDALTDELKNAFDGSSEVKWEEESHKKEELGLCSKCNMMIKESAVLAGSSTFHPDCFTCTHCGNRLGTKFFYVDNQPYCEAHHTVSLSVCGECGDYIKEGSVMVNGASYHPTCFICSECGQVIDNKFYTTEDNKFICQLDYQQSRTKCSHCGLPILERILSAVDKKFHPDCFRCALCDAGLDGIPFLLSGNTFNCQPCYAKYKAHPCVRCGEGIISTGCKKETLITCNGQSFHQQCYTCQDCDTNLVGEFVCCHNNDIICFLCDSKRRK